ncbi:YrhB domain-containing protein [Amycolatopsis sp. NPDC023774]|uniref:YrhB domain-containing protein n=1 Tax=Amycolatopsis sp. NPDC023774 TaxID=3155015 RepID=UPI0033F59E11
MVLQDAFEAAHFLDAGIRTENDVEIVIATCEELDDAWYFDYNSRAFVEQDDPSGSLIGNGPVVVPKSGAKPYIGSVFGPA